MRKKLQLSARYSLLKLETVLIPQEFIIYCINRMRYDFTLRGGGTHNTVIRVVGIPPGDPFLEITLLEEEGGSY